MLITSNCFLQVIGDNLKKKGDEYVFEIGCIFYKETRFSKPNWVINEDGVGWWIIDRDDVLHRIADPIVVAKTSKRTEYNFKSFTCITEREAKESDTFKSSI